MSWLVGLDPDVAALAAAGGVPVALVDRAVLGRAGHADGGVVLLRAVDAVGELVVGGDVVELGGRLVVDRSTSSAPPLKLTTAPPSLPLTMRLVVVSGRSRARGRRRAGVGRCWKLAPASIDFQRL